jgi:hypothetical protein
VIFDVPEQRETSLESVSMFPNRVRIKTFCLGSDGQGNGKQGRGSCFFQKKAVMQELVGRNSIVVEGMAGPKPWDQM